MSLRGFNDWLNERMTPAIKTIVVANVVIWLLIFLVDPSGADVQPYVVGLLGVVPAAWWRAWQYVSYAFIHIGLLDILFHMMILANLGAVLEMRWGGRAFWRFYLITAVGAALVHMLVTQAGVRLGILGPQALQFPVTGASAAVYAVLLAVGAYHPNMPISLLLLPVTFKLGHLVMVLIALGVLLGPVGPSAGVPIVLWGLAIGYVLLARRHKSWDLRSWRWR